MIISVKQLNQIHALLQNQPKTTHVVIRSEINGSGIGPSDFVDFYKGSLFNSQELLETIEITDYGMW
jgi:hypothetical protein